MAARVQLSLAAALTLVALALGGVLVFRSDGSEEGRANASAVGPTGWAGSLAPPGIRAADFRLTDQDGKPVSLRDYRGRTTIVTFQYATCEDTCPILTSQIKAALDDLGRDVPVLAISVDPENDTPLNARRFLLKQKVTGRMRFLRGTRAELEPVWKAYGIQEQGKDFEHSAYVLVLDGEGRRRVSFPYSALTPEGLAHDLRKLGA